MVELYFYLEKKWYILIQYSKYMLLLVINQEGSESNLCDCDWKSFIFFFHVMEVMSIWEDKLVILLIEGNVGGRGGGDGSYYYEIASLSSQTYGFSVRPSPCWRIGKVFKETNNPSEGWESWLWWWEGRWDRRGSTTTNHSVSAH